MKDPMAPRPHLPDYQHYPPASVALTRASSSISWWVVWGISHINYPIISWLCLLHSQSLLLTIVIPPKATVHTFIRHSAVLGHTISWNAASIITPSLAFLETLYYSTFAVWKRNQVTMLYINKHTQKHKYFLKRIRNINTKMLIWLSCWNSG